MAVNYVNDFEEKLASLANAKGGDGIICGHIHQASIREINGIIYLNSGDWVETMSALVEDFDRNWNLEYYATSNSIEKTNGDLEGRNEVEESKDK